MLPIHPLLPVAIIHDGWERIALGPEGEDVEDPTSARELPHDVGDFDLEGFIVLVEAEASRTTVSSGASLRAVSARPASWPAKWSEG